MAAPSIGFYVTLGVAQIVMFQEKEPGFVPQNWAKRLLGSSDFLLILIEDLSGVPVPNRG